MSEENAQPPKEPPESPVDPAVLEIVKANLVARGGSAHQMAVMSYPPAFLMEVLEKVADYTGRKDKALEWLADECLDRELECPSKSAFYRFVALVREEYRLAYMMQKRREAERWTAQLTQDDPQAKQLALAYGLTELATDEMMRAGDAGGADVARFNAITSATVAVNKIVSAKRMTDAKVDALHKEIEHRDASIRVLEQRLLESRQRFDLAAKAVKEKALGAKRAITDQDIDEVRKAVFG